MGNNGKTSIDYSNTNVGCSQITIDASYSNGLYSASTTVQPNSVRTMFIIKF